MSSLTDVVNVGTNLNKNISSLITTIQAAFPVGGANAKLKAFTVAGVPNATTEGSGTMVYITNESGGAVPAFSDGLVWRRVTDRAIIS